MKRFILPLIAATPFLSALVPEADGAAMTSHRPSFNPRQFRAGLLKRRFNYGVAAPAAAANQRASAAAANAVDQILGGSLRLYSSASMDAGVVVTNAGNMTLNGSSQYSGVSGATLRVSGNESDFIRGITTTGVVNVTSGASNWLVSDQGQTGAVILIDSGATLNKTGVGTLTINSGSTTAGDGSLLTVGTVNVNNTTGLLYLDPTLTTLPITVSGGTLVVSSGIVTSSGTLIGLRGRLVLQPDGTYAVLQSDGTYAPFNVVNGDGTVTLFFNGGQVTGDTAGAAAVPEPGSALLLAFGTLAISMVRRRTV